MADEDVLIRCVSCYRIFVNIESYFEHKSECDTLIESSSDDGKLCNDGQDELELRNVDTEREGNSDHDVSFDVEDSIICENELKYSMNTSNGTLLLDRGVLNLLILNLESIVFMLKYIMYANLLLIVLFIIFIGNILLQLSL